MTEVAIQGCTFTISDSLPTLVVATITATGTPSTKVSKSGTGVLKDGFTVSVTAITSPAGGATIADPGPYTASFTSGAVKVKADGTLVLLKGDKTATIKATPKIPSSPKPIDYSVTFKIEITDAGQTKIKAA